MVKGVNDKNNTSRYTYNALFMRINITFVMNSGQSYSRDYVIDYTSNLKTRDLMVYAHGEYEQSITWRDDERVLQITNLANSQERLLYIHEDLRGTTKFLTKSGGQVYSELFYDAWGFPKSPNKLINNDRGTYITANFTGHSFDTVLDMYFAQARFYDAMNRQWVSRDPAKDGLNWYTYCNNNPKSYIDPTGLFIIYKDDSDGENDEQGLFKTSTRWLARILMGNEFNIRKTQNPGSKLESAFSVAGFYKSPEGIYYAKQDAWQQIGGYNWIYDVVFDHATTKKSDSFEFSSGDREYVLWAWFGDYLNLGAGAEMGIYSNVSGLSGKFDVKSPHGDLWLVDTNISLRMVLALEYMGRPIIFWNPQADENYEWDRVWWLAGFNPFYPNVDVSKLVAKYAVTFDSYTMYFDFFRIYGKGESVDSRWEFYPNTLTATFRFS